MDKKDKKKIVSACAAFGDNQIKKIIFGCNLKPTETWKVWEDSSNNKIVFNKKFNVKLNEKNSISDIYIKTHPKNIIKSSACLMVISFGENCLFFLFYGVDNTFRCSYTKGSEWVENVSPLQIGLQGLTIAVNSLKIKDFSEIDVPFSLTNKSKVNNVWVSKVPVSEGFLKNLKNKGIDERIIKENFNGN